MRAVEHPLYSRWRFWQQACYNSNSPNYRYAGAQGVKVKFKNFWEMVDYIETELGQAPYGDNSRLTRINQKGHFAAGNLRWETPRELVSRNSRSVRIRYQGQTKCLREWAHELGMNPATLYTRIRIWNWPTKKAFETPIKSNGTKKTLSRS